MNDCNLVSYAWQGVQTPGHAYQLVALLCLTSIGLTFVVSTLTRNYSQVDKLWSILPVCYVWLLVADGRTFLMAFVATLWGIRLSYNFARRGGYQWPPWRGEEDYRWAVLKQGKYLLPALANPKIWVLFNLFFISIYQNVLLLWMIAPSVVAHSLATAPECLLEAQSLNWLDALAILFVLGFVYLESTADDQQYDFQIHKYRLVYAKKPLTGVYAKGFCTSGLFAHVRKPNYAAEQAIWISFYLFSVAASTEFSLVNWAMPGWILLCMLFQGSAWFTEAITQDKYPAYKEYKKQVPLFIPRILGRSNDNKTA